MEDILEHRIEIDKKACAGIETDWKELYDGECESCGRTYEAVYLVDFDYQTDPHQLEPEKGDCISCWRKSTISQRSIAIRPKSLLSSDSRIEVHH